MGCGASTVLEQTPRQPSNVEKMQENHVAKTPLEQPIQQSEPRNAIPKLTATKVEPEPVQQEPVKAAPSEPEHQQPESVEKSLGSDKTAPTYTEDSLQEILELEKKLSSVESNGFVGQYQTQHKLLVNCYTALQAAQKKVDDLKQQTIKEYRDVAVMHHPNVRMMFSNVYQLQSQMAKEQQEYMDALNRQEVAEKKLKSQQEEYNALYAEVQSLQNQCQELQKLREERERKLDEIFDGKYGSELEEQLEAETDLLTERKEMISRTSHYWKNAKVLMEHATQQLAYATRRWAQINGVSLSMIQARYAIVAETRNYLIAASQNINNTHRYLGSVNIPYCTNEDLKVLNAAVAMIFNDFMKRDTYLRALQTYSALHIKANSLHQWISMVLEKTITRDLEQIVPLWQKKMVALKRERLKLIHIKLRELQGKDTSEDISDQILLLEHAPEGMAEVLPSDTHIAEPDTVSLREDNAENVSHSGDKMPASDGERDKPTTGNDAPATSEAAKAREEPSPPETAENVATLASTSPHSDDINEMDNDTSLNAEKAGEHTEKSPEEDKNAKNDSKEIADLLETTMKVKPLTELEPAPNMDVLFGNIEELKTKYEEQVAQFAKAQDVNKARLDQALQDKLRARRIKKQAIELQDTSELAKGVTSSLEKLF